MNDLLPPSQPASQSHSAPPAPPAQPKEGRRGDLPAPQRLVIIGFALLALVLLAQWWTSYTEVKNLRREMAQRLQAGDTVSHETKVLVKSVQDSAKELQAKVAVLEGKQQEAQSQQLALEQLYQDLSKNRDDWALSEIEQVLSTASQQLQLAGNVRGALIALQNADARLSRSDKPQFITIRRALGRDQERLKALPTVDLTGIALWLDSVIGQVDKMPLLSDERPAAPAAQPKNARRPVARETVPETARKTNLGADWMVRAQDTWYSLTGELWSEVRQLIRVRSVESSDALLLSPTQAYYARENLKLRLLNARLALLSRNESAFRSDLLAAQDAITKYFDTRAGQTQTAQALLKRVQASNLAIEMPTLADSLNAVRNFKARP